MKGVFEWQDIFLENRVIISALFDDNMFGEFFPRF